MTRLNKSEFTSQLAAKANLTRSEAERILNTFIHLIYDTVATGGTVVINGFGQFGISHRKARLGVNPRTFQKIMVPARQQPTFRAGLAFKDAVKLRE